MRIDPLSSIGFYAWLDLTLCTLKGLRAALHFDGLLPEFAPTRSILVGRFHHRMMELAERANSTHEVDIQADIEIAKLQRIVSSTPQLRRLGSVSGWDEINVSVTTAARTVRSSSSRTPAKQAHTEIDLYSTDRLLVGRPDYFAIHSDIAEIKDYKTGALRTLEGAVIQRNVDQLRFYSALLFDNFSISSVSGRIVGLNGDRCEVSITPEDAFHIGTLAKQTLVKANAMLNADVSTLATPSSEACNHCRLQLICPAFLRAKGELSLDDGQMLLDGPVIAKGSSSRTASVEITVHDTVLNADIPIGIPLDLAAHIEVSSSVRVSNLRQHGSRFLWGFDSRVYVND